MNTKEAIKIWNEGGEIKSVELGGLGAGYENAIQQEIIPLCEKIIDHPILKNGDKKIINKFWNSEYNKMLLKQVKGKGLSGAMAGAIKTVAWQFAKYGYDYMMTKAPKDRIITIKKE